MVPHSNFRAAGAQQTLLTLLVQVPLYSAEIVERYKHSGGGGSGDATEPHVFLTADSAYKAMRSGGRSQSVVISGESGSGKTETTKIAMQVLRSVLFGRRTTSGLLLTKLCDPIHQL